MNQETVGNTMGKRIAYLRREKGYTQEQLAEIMSVSPQAVSKWENDISSPDISLIPKLAEVLGVSTDELLGVKPVEPHVVVVDTGSANKKQNDSGYEFRFKGGKWSSVVFGLFLLALGALFLLQEFGIAVLPNGISFWSIAWSVLLVGFGISMLKESWFPVSIGCILVGAYNLMHLLVLTSLPTLTWGMIWPLALLLIGLSCITSGLIRKRTGRARVHGVHCHDDKKASVVESNDDGNVNLECSFTETRYSFDGETFKSAHIENNFGSTVFDLRACKAFDANATVYAEVNFGSVVILLPPSIALNKQVDNVFAACSVKGAPHADTPFRLTVQGSVNFGSIELRY